MLPLFHNSRCWHTTMWHLPIQLWSFQVTLSRQLVHVQPCKVWSWRGLTKYHLSYCCVPCILHVPLDLPVLLIFRIACTEASIQWCSCKLTYTCSVASSRKTCLGDLQDCLHRSCPRSPSLSLSRCTVHSFIQIPVLLILWSACTEAVLVRHFSPDWPKHHT